MISVADVRTYILTWVLTLQNLYFKTKIYLGWTATKHGIIGHFVHEDYPCSTMTHHPERIRNIQKYDNLRPDDVIVLTYPKCGTHLTGEIIYSIYKAKGLMKANLFSPFTPFEMMPAILMFVTGKSKAGFSTEDIDAAPSPRIIGTHLPWRFLPQKVKDGKVKVIHCTRNPKDTACSAMTFLQKMNIFVSDFTWSDFVNLFCSENMYCGSFFSFIRDWYPNRKLDSVLNLHFEDMTKNLETNVRRIAKFLNIELTDEEIRQIVTDNTFENKKKAAGKYHPIYNKGKSGGWRSKFTLEQNDMMDGWIAENMKDFPDLKFDYQ